MRNVYRVVAAGGCAVRATPSEASKIVGRLAHGEHVLVKRRRHRAWMKLARPLRGWVPLYRTIAKGAPGDAADAADEAGAAGADADAALEGRRRLRFQYARRDQATGFTRY